MNAMNEELPRIQEQVYYGQITSHTDVLEKFLFESGINRYNPQVTFVIISFSIRKLFLRVCGTVLLLSLSCIHTLWS